MKEVTRRKYEGDDENESRKGRVRKRGRRKRGNVKEETKGEEIRRRRGV